MDLVKEIKKQISSVFIGKEEFLDLVMITLLSEGNLLLEDIPGVGKTTLATALAKVISCDFGRIQFTPDTMPSDVVGVSVYQMDKGCFTYQKGAVYHQILLADEINRTSPKTQSALLEAMEEHQVTVDGAVYPLPSPFFVIATQNPVEFAGTYPLPEAQMDRFLMRLSIGYPDAADAARMAENFLAGVKAKEVEAVCRAEDILQLQKQVQEVKVHTDLIRYLTRIMEETRNPNVFRLGASPRAMLHLLRASQAKAFLSGRNYCTPDDIRSLLHPVLDHRLILQPELKMKKVTAGEMLDEAVKKVAVPVMK